jgi:drug/metabolite transporter (DMT)-like permease
MFLGEFLCFGAYGLHVLREKYINKRNVSLLPKASLYIFAIPAFLDIFVVGLMNVALTMMPASTLQMMKGGTILITAILSLTFLKRKLDRQHWGAMGMIFIGLYLVGRVEAEEEKSVSETLS